MPLPSWNPLPFRLRKDQPQAPPQDDTSTSSNEEWVLISSAGEVQRNLHRPTSSSVAVNPKKLVLENPATEGKPPPRSFHALIQLHLDNHRPLTRELFIGSIIAHLREKHGDGAIFLPGFPSPQLSREKREELLLEEMCLSRKREEHYLDFMCSGDFRAGVSLYPHKDAGTWPTLLETMGEDVRKFWEAEVSRYPGPIHGYGEGLESAFGMFRVEVQRLGETLGLLEMGLENNVALQPEGQPLIEVIDWLQDMEYAATGVEGMPPLHMRINGYIVGG